MPDELEVKTPMVSGTLKGENIIMIILVALGLLAIVYIVHTDASSDKEEHRQLANLLATQVEQQEVQNWLLSMPQDRRPQLKKPLGAERYLISKD